MVALNESLVRVVRDGAQPLGRGPWQLDGLIELIGSKRIVLMGEATHGTHEFYEFRAELTKRLIEERGFQALAVEADWPDAYRVNRFVRGLGRDRQAIDALADFRRFPMWMWRNTEVLGLIEWLRGVNDGRPRGQRVGFYGLDLYSLYSSMQAVIRYLEHVDPDGAARARARYACFEGFGGEPQQYGRAAALGLSEKCEQEALEQLLELRQKAAEYLRNDGVVAEDELFFAEQNAVVAAHAERYYRTMFGGRVSSWNLRDQHMAATLDALVAHLGRLGGPAKVIVWAHNSHLGDARATEMGEEGELNLGQLARQRFGDQCFSLGFSTYWGTVSAASEWDGPVQQKKVRPGLRGSYEDTFHQAQVPDFLLKLNGDDSASELRQRLLQRAIGVIYRPETERQSHYFHVRLADQFDAVVHLDRTRALEPLDLTSEWEMAAAPETPETYPTGL